MVLCQECRYWVKSREDKSYRLRGCGSPKVLYGYDFGYERVSDDGVMVENDEGWGCLTGPMFGCVNGERLVGGEVGKQNDRQWGGGMTDEERYKVWLMAERVEELKRKVLGVIGEMNRVLSGDAVEDLKYECMQLPAEIRMLARKAD